jgi:hypothetical protein
MVDEEQNSLTRQQNRSLHKLFADISAHCVQTGLDQKAIVSALENHPIPVSPQFVKDTWKAMQFSLTGKRSTQELERKEVDQVYDVFNKFWSELTGEHFAFPSIEEMLFLQLDDNGNLR